MTDIAEVDWQMVGSWADWSTALIAALALIAAVYAGRAAWKANEAQQAALMLQREEFAAAQDSAERLQASKVAAYMMSRDDGMVVQDEVHLINASGSPVFDVSVREVTAAGNEFDLAPPMDFLLPTGSKPIIWVAEEPYENERPLTMSFRDAAGVKWVRMRHGNLMKDV